MKFMQRRFIGLLGALAVTLASALAGSASAQPSAEDPPGRVARLSEVSGQAWLYSPDSAEWTSADRNRPLTSGDRLATDPGARAVLQVGSTTIRLDASTEVEVLQLDDDHISLQLHGGSINTRLRNMNDAGEVDVTTEDGRFVFQRAGRYRIDRDRPASHLTVYAGQAVYEGPNSALTVNPGQRAEFWLDSSNAAQYSLSSPVNDEFSAWNGERDRSADRTVAPRYVSPEMTGVEELERYGRWEQSPDYGALWIPSGVAVGWAPYSTGHWAYVRPWGWTWVDDAPWGFAPFHYGRWVNVRNTWCWTPGARVARPVYAPALVAWVGGPRVNVSVSIGGGPAVGWFPLAPREVYVPSYRVTPRYAQSINITHVTNVTNITAVFNNPQAPRDFGNRRFPNAVTVVPAGVMTARQPVAPAAAQLRNTPWVREIANEPRRGEAMVVAPVAAPIALVQPADRRPIAPPPGAGGEPRAPREFGPRPRFEAGRPAGQATEPARSTDRRDEGRRPDSPAAPRPVGAMPPAPVIAPAAQPAANPAPAPTPAARPAPEVRPAPDAPGRRPERERERERGDDRRGQGREGAAPMNPAPAAVAPVRPAAQAPAQPAPQVAPIARPAPAAEPTPRPAPRVEPSAAAAVPRAPQRAEPLKAAEPVQPVKPAAEAPRPAAAPDAKRPENPVRVRAEQTRDERRGDARSDRGDKKE